jgi:EAL domain-containing protein (putative c-di-GMP-specific phosphodiesterase class I)
VALHVNASPALLHDDRLLRLLGQYPDRQVVLEITEHEVVDDYDRLATSLQRLRDTGAKIAVDDVGAGIASLRHIVRIAPDTIKLDISLTQHLRHDPVRRALARALVQFAQDTGTLLVAEGIESEADLVMWRRLGADGGQGYLLARPGPLPIQLSPSPRITSRRRRTPQRELAFADLSGMR